MSSRRNLTAPKTLIAGRSPPVRNLSTVLRLTFSSSETSFFVSNLVLAIANSPFQFIASPSFARREWTLVSYTSKLLCLLTSRIKRKVCSDFVSVPLVFLSRVYPRRVRLSRALCAQTIAQNGITAIFLFRWSSLDSAGRNRPLTLQSKASRAWLKGSETFPAYSGSFPSRILSLS